jgi:hypothetical protein
MRGCQVSLRDTKRYKNWTFVSKEQFHLSSAK